MTDPFASVQITPEPWTRDAACVGTNPDAFVPDRKGGSTREARAICAGCPVREQCLEFAIRTNEQHGIYGGMTPRMRRNLRRNK